MKKIIEFTINKTEEIEREEVSVNEKGEQIKTLKKEKQEVPYSFCLKKPNRVLTDEASLFYGVKVAEGIKAGLLTIPLLEKRNINDGGIFSEADKAKYLQLWEELYNLEQELQSIDIKKTEDQSEEEKNKRAGLIKKITDNRVELQRLEMFRNSVYDNTAEIRAKNWTVTWWLLNLAYKKVGTDKYEPFFGEGNFDKRLEKYDELTDKDDPFLNKVLFKFLTYTTLWANNRTTNPEDFEKFEKLMAENMDGSIDKAS